MKVVMFCCVVVLSGVTLLAAQGPVDDRPRSVPEFDYIPPKGIFPGFNAFNLLGGTVSPTLLMVDQWLKPTSTYVVLASDLQPVGFVNGAHFPDLDVNLTWSALLYQGLAASQPLIASINPANIYLGYRGYFSRNRESRELSNIALAGLLFDTVTTDRLFNTRAGVLGRAQVEWAPRALANDVLGLSDFVRLSSSLSFNLPLVEEPSFSLSLFQKTAFDMAWFQPGAMPLRLEYSTGTIGSAAVRGAVIPDGGAMHLAGNLDLRLNFPQAIDTAIMPGLIVFWDWGFFDRQDYQFDFRNWRTSLGLDLVLHLDLVALAPVSGALDVQAGVVWELVEKQFGIHFSTSLPS